MNVFLDSSALVKRYIEEPGSDQVGQILQNASSLGVSILCLPEITSGLRRRVREKFITESEYRWAKEVLLRDIDDSEVVQATADVISTSIDLLETSGLRGADAVHVASALLWKADLFLSSDQRQLSAADKAGLACQQV